MPRKPHPAMPEVRGVLERVTEAHAALVAQRDDARTALAALDTAEATKALTARYRADRRQAIRDGAAKPIRERGGQAVALATATLASRDRLTGMEAVLDAARFCPPLEAPTDAGLLPFEQREAVERLTITNELRALRDELTRTRVRAELTEAAPGELAERIAVAAAHGDLATLAVASSVVRRRTAQDTAEMLDASAALATALRALPVPDDVAELVAAFDDLERVAGEVGDILAEADSGFLHEHDTNTKLHRLQAAIAAHGELDGPRAYADDEHARRVAHAADAADRVPDELRAATTATAA